MDEEIAQALEKTAAYVEQTQRELDKAASAREGFMLELEKTAAVLVNRGILEEARQRDWVQKCAESPVRALQFLQHLSGCVGADALGAPSTIKAANADQADPWVREFFPERLGSVAGVIY